MQLNNQQMVHILSEAVIILAITFYYSTKFKYLEKKIILQSNRINELESNIEEQGKILKLVIHRLSVIDPSYKDRNNDPDDKTNDNTEDDDSDDNALKKRKKDFMKKMKAQKQNEPKIIEIDVKNEEEVVEEVVDDEGDDSDEEEEDEEDEVEEEAEEEDEDEDEDEDEEEEVVEEVNVKKKVKKPKGKVDLEAMIASEINNLN